MKLSDLINELMEELKRGDCNVGFSDGCISDINFVYRYNFNDGKNYVLLSQEFFENDE